MVNNPLDTTEKSESTWKTSLNRLKEKGFFRYVGRSLLLILLIYVLVVIQFTLSALFEPGQSALTPSLVRQKDLVLANTLGSITWSTMLAVGAIIGAVVADVAGSEAALIIDDATFLVSALLITQIVVTSREELGYDSVIEDQVSEARDDGGFWRGIRYLRDNPTTAAVALVKGGGSIGNVAKRRGR